MKFLKLGMPDLLKGVIVAFLTALVTSVYTILQTGVLPTLAELKVAAIAGLTAAVAYLIKNFFTNSEGKFLKREP